MQTTGISAAPSSQVGEFATNIPINEIAEDSEAETERITDSPLKRRPESVINAVRSKRLELPANNSKEDQNGNDINENYNEANESL